MNSLYLVARVGNACPTSETPRMARQLHEQKRQTYQQRCERQRVSTAGLGRGMQRNSRQTLPRREVNTVQARPDPFSHQRQWFTQPTPCVASYTQRRVREWLAAVFPT